MHREKCILLWGAFSWNGTTIYISWEDFCTNLGCDFPKQDLFFTVWGTVFLIEEISYCHGFCLPKVNHTSFWWSFCANLGCFFLVILQHMSWTYSVTTTLQKIRTRIIKFTSEMRTRDLMKAKEKQKKGSTERRKRKRSTSSSSKSSGSSHSSHRSRRRKSSSSSSGSESSSSSESESSSSSSGREQQQQTAIFSISKEIRQQLIWRWMKAYLQFWEC